MDWKFWRKRHLAIDGSNAPKIKMSGPKELPDALGIYLVTHEKRDPDWTWSLRCMLRRQPDKQSSYDFRVFNPIQEGIETIYIKDFSSLDHHPEFILFQGSYDKRTCKVELKETDPDNKFCQQ
jgi:hypothetical protein